MALSNLPVVALSSIYLITPIAGAKQPGCALKYILDHTNGIVINTLEPKWLRLGVYIVDREFPYIYIYIYIYIYTYVFASVC